MRLDLHIGKVTVPLADLTTVAAGFYLGYNHGHGADISTAVEALTIGAPTAVRVIGQLIGLKHSINNADELAKKNYAKTRAKDLADRLCSEERNLDELTEEELDEEAVKAKLNIPPLVRDLKNPDYKKHAKTVGLVTVAETLLGYGLGRASSYFF